MYYRTLFTSFLFVIFVVACSQNSAPEIDIDVQIEQFSRKTDQIVTKSYAYDDFKNYSDDYKLAFQHSFPIKMQQHIIKTASKEQLSKLKSDIHTYLLTTNDSVALKFVEDLYERLAANNWLTARDEPSMYSLYLSMRQFEKAGKFKQNHPDTDLSSGLKIENWQSYSRTPNIGKRFVFDTVKDKNYLRLNQIDFSNYTGVVATIAPGCHFFTNFLKSVGADADLSTAFIDNTLWLTNEYLTNNNVIDWNKSMPKVQLHYRVYASDWPEINYWGSPSFYFFKDGKLTKKVVGWPRDQVDARTLALVDGFKAIGIELHN